MFSIFRLMSTVGKDLEAETSDKINKGNNEEAKKMASHFRINNFFQFRFKI